MKRTLTTILSIILIGFSPSLFAQEQTGHTMRYKGEVHEYSLFLPEGLPANAPLVVVLHGYGGNGKTIRPRLIEIAKEYGFAVCSPTGLEDPKGKKCWNVGYPSQEGLKRDDVGFVCKLTDKVCKEHALDRKNCFLTGMSNGGEMCYLTAMKKPRAFNAMASIAGLTLECMDRDYKAAVPFMEIHGTEDRTSEWSGDHANAGGWGAYLSVPVAVSYLIAANKCVAQTEQKLPVLRNEVVLHTFYGGLPAWKGGPGCEVLLYEVKGGKHSWAEGDLDTCLEIWKFFSKYLR